MDKEEFRRRAYACYHSGFKSTTSATNADDTPGAQRHRDYLRGRLGPWVREMPRLAAVADLGCGDGMLLRTFAEMGFTNLHGVEGSYEMYALCRQRFEAVEHGDLRDYLRRHVAAFDVIALFDVFEHFTREEGTVLLAEIHAALRAGGRLILQLPNGDSPFAHGVFAGDVTHETLYTRGSLAHMLAIAGLELVAVDEASPQASDFRSSARWLAWKILRSVIGICHRIETGGNSSGVYTRVMRACARRPDK
jgi:SAM-dependent methyltransferase